MTEDKLNTILEKVTHMDARLERLEDALGFMKAVALRTTFNEKRLAIMQDAIDRLVFKSDGRLELIDKSLARLEKWLEVPEKWRSEEAPAQKS